MDPTQQNCQLPKEWSWKQFAQGPCWNFKKNILKAEVNIFKQILL